MYWIPFHIGLGLFISLCMNPIRSAPTIRNNSAPRTSAGGTKMDLAQSIPLCFTYKHRNPLQNAPKHCFDNRMASMQMRLMDCLTDRPEQRKQQIWYHDEIILVQNSVNGLFFRYRVNTRDQ